MTGRRTISRHRSPACREESSIKQDILIVGAGPTGLAAALFLFERGHFARIVEKREARSPFSKAFGVNARSLDLLSASGVTGRFLQNGRRLDKLRLRRRNADLATLCLGNVDHRFPFMCVQSQSDSERILTEALQERGIAVERNVRATAITAGATSATVSLETPSGPELVTARTVLGADGAGSFVRKSLGIAFDGVSYSEPWKLYDIELATSLQADDGHVFLLDEGGMFVVRHEGSIWRVLGNSPDLLGALPPGTRTGKVHWESDFFIANRVAGKFSNGVVHLAGDAAHVHAGIGARGMNLGIEDAFVFATLYDRGQLDAYDRLRRPTVERVVGQIGRAMMVPRPRTVPGRFVRTFPSVVRLVLPRFQSRVAPWILGLDHDVLPAG